LEAFNVLEKSASMRLPNCLDKFLLIRHTLYLDTAQEVLKSFEGGERVERNFDVTPSITIEPLDTQAMRIYSAVTLFPTNARSREQKIGTRCSAKLSIQVDGYGWTFRKSGRSLKRTSTL